MLFLHYFVCVITNQDKLSIGIGGMKKITKCSIVDEILFNRKQKRERDGGMPITIFFFLLLVATMKKNIRSVVRWIIMYGTVRVRYSDNFFCSLPIEEQNMTLHKNTKKNLYSMRINSCQHFLKVTCYLFSHLI